MKKQPALAWLVPLIFTLAALSALAGLFWQKPGEPFRFMTLFGQTAEMYGQGLYANDTVFSAATFRATDAITLVVGLPLLAIAYALYRKDSLPGGLLLSGALAYFTYIGVSMTFGAMYNPLFLVYTALFSASLFAFTATLLSIEPRALESTLAAGYRRAGPAAFMLVAGAGVLFLWLSELVGPALSGEPPELLGPYTTMFTYGFDLAVIAPAAILTGICLLRRKPLGDLLTAPMLILCTLIGLVVIASTIAQTLAGITFAIGVYIGMIGSWVVLGGFAVWQATVFFRHIRTPRPAENGTIPGDTRQIGPAPLG